MDDKLMRRDGDVVLRDGSTVHIHVMRSSDEAGLCALLTSLSEESRWLRFYSLQNSTALAAEAHREANLDQAFGLVARSGDGARVVGHAFYVVIEGKRAEVAFTIANDFQRRGLGSILLCQLAEVAASNGIEIFEAEVIATNHAMLHVFRQSGFPIEVNASAGQLHVAFPTSFTAEARKQFERRESIAAVNALKLFFEPRAVAVIGASRQRGTIGGELFHNLLSFGFKDSIYPVNPAATVIENVESYPSVEEIPGPVDLAVIVVPAAKVVEVASACARKGVKERRETYPARFADIRTDEAAAVVAAALARGEGWLTPAEVAQICSCYGLPLIEQRFVASADEAGAAAAEMGGEIALKAIAPGLVHKTEAGAVRLHLSGAEVVSAAAQEMSERLSPS